MPLEVTALDIQRLTDGPVRELVGRLCRAELSDAGLPSSAVMTGGHQDAADGGIDVRVDLRGSPAGLDFISRAQTGLQIKAGSMPPSKVAAEMTTAGQIKPTIRELLARRGAYVLVSANDACTDRMRRERLAAMEKVATDAGLPPDVALDFLGSDRLADWANRHAGVALWVREQLDGAHHGWHAHGAWAAGLSDVGFLVDQQLRVESDRGDRLTVPQALVAMRRTLSVPGQAVRLVGLSGTGKTRLVQALFEAGPGGEPLPSHLAVYGNVGEDGLDPPAASMLRRLAASGRPHVLVVDNCNPELHRTLGDALRQRFGRLSLLTVEYDIQSGEAEETEVYHLSGASPGLLRALLARRYPRRRSAIEQVIELSEGNMRLALALASAVERSGDLAKAPGAEFFSRLFWQRGAHDADLEHTARVLALVYSFDMNEPEDPSEDHELARLSRLCGLRPQTLLRHIGVLASRGLVQSRGRWRALLPQALAHRLAHEGLKVVSSAHVWRELRSHRRLATSFARRLSALHGSAEARQLVERWFDERPGLALVADFAFQGHEVVLHLAPVRPDLALQRLEALTACDGEGVLGADGALHRAAFRRLAVQLAYDEEHFSRAVAVLAQLVIAERRRHRGAEGEGHDLCALFRPRASGTHASLGMRLASLALWLDSTPEHQDLASRALVEALQTTWPVRSPHSFGAHVRDCGWQPDDSDGWQAWYGEVLAFISARMTQHAGQAATLAQLVGQALPGLIRRAHLAPTLEAFLTLQRGQPYARYLWQGVVVAMLDVDAPPRDPASGKAMHRLEQVIRPCSFQERIDALVLTRPYGPLDVLAAERRALQGAGAPNGSAGVFARELADLASQLAARFHEPGLVEHWMMDGPEGYIPWLGLQTARASRQLREDWAMLRRRHANDHALRRGSALLEGFFNGICEGDPVLAEELLVDVAAEPGLSSLCLDLHATQPLTEAGVGRLAAIARSGLVAAEDFSVLEVGLELHEPPPPFHAQLVRAIAAMPSGLPVALRFQRAYLRRSQASKADSTRTVCAELLLQVDEGVGRHVRWHLARLAEIALTGPAGPSVARHMGGLLAEYTLNGIPGQAAEKLTRQLFALQPQAALNAFSRSDTTRREADRWLLADLQSHPVRLVSEETLLEWAAEDASERDVWLAKRIVVLCAESKGFTPLAQAILDRAAHRSRILEAFKFGGAPSGVIESYATQAQPYLVALAGLAKSSTADVAAWASAQLRWISGRMTHWTHPEQRFE